MNSAIIIRILGVLSITGAGVSFLMEGWNDFNGLEKYLGFFLFVTTLLILAELFKRNYETVSRVFASLVLVTAPVIMAQLGAFLFIPTDTTVIHDWLPQMAMPESAPLKLITISSVFIFTTIVMRSVSILKSGQGSWSSFYIVLASFLFLIPVRSAEFHGLAILGLTSLSILTYKRFSFDKMPNPLAQLICVAAPLYFVGRACLYQIDQFMLLAFYFIGATLLLRYLPQFGEDKILTKILHFFGYVCSILCLFEIFKIFPGLTDNYQLLFTQIIMVFLVYKHPDSRNVGFFQMNFMAWSCVLLNFATKQNLDLTTILITLTVPSLLVVSTYIMREKFAFCSASLLLIISIMGNIRHVMHFPVVNLWMVLGVVGIILVILSSMVDNAPTKMRRVYERMMKVFDQEIQ